MSLTVKQHELMLYLQRYQDAKGGVSPSFDEMTARLNLHSKSGVHRLLNALEERGFIRRMPHRARAIEILRRVPDPYPVKQISDDARGELLAFATEVANAPHIDGFGWRMKATKLLEKIG